jgi:hypothetical protein
MVPNSRAREALEYIERLEETFATPGWKQLIEEARAQLYQYQADVCELRGQVVQLSRLINLEEVTGILRAQAEDRILEDEADADL